MSANAKQISISVFYDGEKHVIETYAHAYRNLMTLLYNELFLDDFGECLGMGKCGTCMIEILSDPKGMHSFDRNEQTTMDKIGVSERRIRLSCQILVDEGIDGLELRII